VKNMKNSIIIAAAIFAVAIGSAASAQTKPGQSSVPAKPSVTTKKPGSMTAKGGGSWAPSHKVTRPSTKAMSLKKIRKPAAMAMAVKHVKKPTATAMGVKKGAEPAAPAAPAKPTSTGKG
jgi:hypothetical protein